MRMLLATALLLAGCGQAAPAAPRVAVPAAVRAASSEPPIPELPKFALTRDGKPNDPINLAIVGSERRLVEGFARAGWVGADPLTFKAVMKLARAFLTGGEYPTSPISAAWLFQRPQDYAFQKNAVGIKARDHLRIWRSPHADAQGRPYWAIAASEDVSLGMNGLRPIHHIDRHIDEERALVVSDLHATGLVARERAYQSLPPGFKGKNAEGDPYVTDGRVIVLDLLD